MNAPVSLRDLPATVVDLVGVGAGSPFPGSSLRARWNPQESRSPAAEVKISPAFSEQADWSTLETKQPHTREFGEFQMSLVAEGKQYVRDGSGAEHLFDLAVDPFEMDNLMQHPGAEQRVAPFRKMLLDFLVANPASVAVERGYLSRYREQLRAAVGATSPKIASAIRAAPQKLRPAH